LFSVSLGNTAVPINPIYTPIAPIDVNPAPLWKDVIQQQTQQQWVVSGHWQDGGGYTSYGVDYYVDGGQSLVDGGGYTSYGIDYYIDGGQRLVDGGGYTSYGIDYYIEGGQRLVDGGGYTSWGQDYYINGGQRLVDGGGYTNWGQDYYIDGGQSLVDGGSSYDFYTNSFYDNPDYYVDNPDIFVDVPDVWVDYPDYYVDNPDIFVDVPDVWVDYPDYYVDNPDIFVDAPDVWVDYPDYYVDNPDVFVDVPDVWVDYPDFYVDNPDVFVDVPDTWIDNPDIWVDTSHYEAVAVNVTVQVPYSDPVVLDLDGNGIQLSAYSTSSVRFDVDNDTSKSLEVTGWVSATDGILALDRNGNGKIDGASELVSEFLGASAGMRTFNTGLDALNALDRDSAGLKDGKLNNSDSYWTQLRVWVDANQNAQTDAGELKSLAELGITEINLNAHASTAAERTNIADNTLATVGSFTRNGVSRAWGDVLLRANPNGVVTTVSGTGQIVSTDAGTRSYVSSTAQNELLSTASLGVNNVYAGSGNDSLTGDAGSNWLAGGIGSDTFNAGAGDDVLMVDADDKQVNIHAGAGTDIVRVTGIAGVSLNLTSMGVEIAEGGVGDDMLIGGGRSTVVISGGGGNDVLLGGAANDILAGDEGQDALFGEAGNDLVRGGLGDDELWGGLGADILDGGNGNDSLDGGADVDTMTGGAGNDTYVVDVVGDVVVEVANEGIDTIISSVTRTLGANQEDLVLSGTVAINATGNELNNSLFGIDNASANVLSGGLGNDTYYVGAGDTVVEAAGGGIDTVNAYVNYSLGANQENLIGNLTTGQRLSGNTLDNTIVGNTGSDNIDGGAGNDSLNGGAGVDTLSYASATAAVAINLALATAQVTGGAGTDTLLNFENLTGSSFNDSLSGNATANVLDGGIGIDSMAGGAGNDTYVVDSAGDVVNEALNEGVDTVIASVTRTLGVNQENLTLSGVAAISGTGNELSNVLAGNAAANVLDGGIGIDTMAGGVGNDTYVVDNAGDSVNEALNEGVDTVIASITRTLGVNQENLTLSGVAAISGTGNELNNVLTGNAATNYLDGQVGADTMSGGAGGDVYWVDNAGDVVNEGVNEGYDTIYTTVSYTLGANQDAVVVNTAAAVNVSGNGLDNYLYAGAGNNAIDGGLGNDTVAYTQSSIGVAVSLALTTAQATGGSGSDTLLNVENLAGSSYNDSLSGNAGANIINGYAGADAMAGGAGEDSYYVDNVGDIVTELANDGVGDVIYSTVSYTAGANVERLYLDGAAAINATGNALDNILYGYGNTAANVLTGGLGNDLYYVAAGDTVVEAVGGGTDVVYTTVDYTLRDNQENLANYVAAGLRLSGNALDNTITGNIGNDTIDGGIGIDIMNGSLGNDTYLVDNAGDVVNEGANEGIDTILSSVTRTLGVNQENLTLSGVAAINGTGNELNNVLTGNAAANVLDGGIGSDTLTGGAGNDSYLVDNAGDVVNEALNEGVDTLITSVTRTLGVNQENLTLAGTAAINGTGNELNNVLTGNAATNYLNGLAGADTMSGGAGDDVYWVDNAGDVVTEALNEGYDTIYSTVNYTLGANQEVVVLNSTAAINATGNGLANSLYAGNGNNTMDGGVGSDTVVYNFATAGVTVNLAITGAQNTVNSGTDTLLNIEHLFGSNFNDSLSGNAGANVINGLAGADTMAGGAGEDSYYVDNVGDVVTELANQGVSDIIYSTVSYTTGANVENLYLDGTAAINATGNALDNILYGYGNTAANVLTGGLGNDSYVVAAGDTVVEAVGAGTDTVFAYVDYSLGANQENLVSNVATGLRLTGNALDNTITGNIGNDTIDGGAGNDSLNGDAGVDTLSYASATAGVSISLALTSAQITGGAGSDTVSNFENLTGSAFNDNLTGNTVGNVLDGGVGIDTMAGGAGNDTYLVDNAGDVITEAVNEGIDTIISSVTRILGTNQENLTLSGAAAINGSGNELSNVLTGNAATNYLDGLAGADTMAGGAGNDIYYADNAGDVVLENADEGTDIVFAAFDYTLTANVEQLRMFGTATASGTGNSLNNLIFVADGSNVIDGLDGVDMAAYNYAAAGVTVSLDTTTAQATGGSGVDTLRNIENLYGSDFNDTLRGNAGNNLLDGSLGVDTVSYASAVSGVSVNLALATAQVTGGAGTDTLLNFENLTGSAFNDSLSGNAAANVLDGGIGIDTLTGGAGNDTYMVDVAGDVVNEGVNEGIDSVISSVTRTLGVNQENLTLSGAAAINGTGNELNNVLTGNAATNYLDGQVGADTMAGGAGGDVYYVDNAGDVVVEGLNEGTDTIYSTVSYTLGANQEHVVLTAAAGIAINATGNDLANNLYSTAGNNILDGAAGADQAVYNQATAGVTVSLAITGAQNTIGAGTDTLLNIENLYGSAYNDVLTGNAAANTLTGFTGADSMAGGAGEDSYYVDNAGDVVIEALNEGVSDIIYSTVSYTTGANVERLYLQGAAAINATGNALDNILYGNGNSAANVLTGGLGNDAYYVGAGDTVVEAAGAGTDNVYVYVDYTLGANQENLYGYVVGDLRLSGNELNNTVNGNNGNDNIDGGAGNDSLNGGAGNDTLDGKVGVDSLAGGVGSDIYLLGRGYGIDTIAEIDATLGNTDIAKFDATVANNQLWFTKVGNNLEVSIIGTSDKLVISNWYLGNQYHVEQFNSGDGKTLLDSQVQNLVNAMAAFTPPAAGVATLPASYATTLLPVLTANWV
jgi:trimeric autotransporter adhesin